MTERAGIRAIAGVSLAGALAFGALAGASPVAADNDQLDETTDTVYHVLPDAGVVRSASTTVLKNTVKPTTRKGPCKNGKGRCKIRTTYYFDGWKGIYVPHSASTFQIGGPGVTTTLDEDAGAGDVYVVRFPRLQYRKKQKVTSSFEIPAGEVDTNDPTRIEDGYLHFCWFGQSGDRGTVKAFLPSGYEPISYIGSPTATDTPEGVVLRAPKGAEVSLWMGCTEAFAPHLLRHSYVVGEEGHTLVTVTSWPGDDAWKERVTEEVERTMPWLEDQLGVPLPAGSIEIRESARQARYYHDGDPRAVDGVIGLAENYRAGGASIRLARAWFGPGDFADPWLAEGLAVWAATRAGESRCPEATAYPGEGSPDLDGEWVEVTPTSSHDDVTVADWQSIASCRLIEAGSDIVGEPAMVEIARKLLTAPVRVGTSHWLEAVSAGLPE
ncbi:MAG: hypothetical protein PVG27_12045, partial [Chloroflexota bacterium]